VWCGGCGGQIESDQ